MSDGNVTSLRRSAWNRPAPLTDSGDAIDGLGKALDAERVSGAGYGDRTRVRGLGSLCTTIVLSPRTGRPEGLRYGRDDRRDDRARKYITRESAPAPRRV